MTKVSMGALCFDASFSLFVNQLVGLLNRVRPLAAINSKSIT
ncbi:MAG: hypothetical protein ACI9XC_000294 [Gammaproteobacteria bacterium]|jgi:hypothetical protein